ncbi:CatB-related O-acetyltransferase [Lentilitoribacter sp. EG35]|uniref:CatB-related O-acetyltransferase n=1 Tax=Lentilitoribacter sp. EG35 TaxID=3234192 RepID=UPI003460B233
MTLPNPAERNPLVLPDGSRDSATVFLQTVIDHPNIEVGAYTYYHDDDHPEDYARTLAPYLFPGAPEALQIGKFCQIAKGVQFITATANHPMTGISTYPFAIFNPERFGTYRASLPRGEDTVIGNDCWIGREAVIMPGATLGNGVIVATRAVVTGHVPDYAIVGGNPAKVIRKRFSKSDIAKLLELAWWDWEPDHIAQAIPAIEGGDVDALAAMAK